MTHLPPTEPISTPLDRQKERARILVIVGFILSGLIIVALIAGLVLANNAARAAESSRDDVRETLTTELSKVIEERDQYKPAFEAREDLQEREAEVLQREQDADAVEAGLTSRENEIQAREDAVQSREDAIQNAGNEEWVVLVRECLARPGDYISASVTDSSWGGIETSCYTG